MPVRYAINGLIAAGVHFSMLYSLLHFQVTTSAGLANALAAIAGTVASYTGARFFVFQATNHPITPQFLKFVLLYTGLAAMHGVVLFAWTDVSGLDYRAGFLLSTALQVAGTYVGGRDWVFKE